MRPISNDLRGFYLHPDPTSPYRAVLTGAIAVIPSYSYALTSTPFGASSRIKNTLPLVGKDIQSRNLFQTTASGDIRNQIRKNPVF